MTGTGRVGGKERGCPVFDEEEEESTTPSPSSSPSSVLLPRDVLVVRVLNLFYSFLSHFASLACDVVLRKKKV